MKFKKSTESHFGKKCQKLELTTSHFGKKCQKLELTTDSRAKKCQKLELTTDSLVTVTSLAVVIFEVIYVTKWINFSNVCRLKAKKVKKRTILKYYKMTFFGPKWHFLAHKCHLWAPKNYLKDQNWFSYFNLIFLTIYSQI